MLSTYDWSIDVGKRGAKCKAKTCFYGGQIAKGECRIKKTFENPSFDRPSQQLLHIDCYLNSTLSMRPTTERVTSESLTDMKGWQDQIDDDLRARVVKIFNEWENGNHEIRWDPEHVQQEQEKKEKEEEPKEEEGKQGKKRKAKGGAKKPVKKKAKTKTVEEQLEEMKESESEHVYLENTTPPHNKFYEIWTKGSHVITKYGAIPSYSKSKLNLKPMDDEEAAKNEMEKTIKQKTSPGKGYSKAPLPA